MLRTAAAAACALALVIADSPAPDSFQGQWTGMVTQGFALANASDPNSYECIGHNQYMSASMMMNVTQDGAGNTGHGQVQAYFQNAMYTMPARPAAQYGWASFTPDNSVNTGTFNTQGIVMLRPSQDPNAPVCKYARLNGNTLTIITLGGQNYDWRAQCNSASYLALPSLSNPTCMTNGQNMSPVSSSVVETYTFQGNRASGATSAAAGVIAAMVAAGAVYAML